MFPRLKLLKLFPWILRQLKNPCWQARDHIPFFLCIIDVSGFYLMVILLKQLKKKEFG